jgi:hypothetical protein
MELLKSQWKNEETNQQAATNAASVPSLTRIKDRSVMQHRKQSVGCSGTPQRFLCIWRATTLFHQYYIIFISPPARCAIHQIQDLNAALVAQFLHPIEKTSHSPINTKPAQHTIHPSLPPSLPRNQYNNKLECITSSTALPITQRGPDMMV